MKHVHGGDIYQNTYRIDFSANLNPLGMPASVREAAKHGVEMSEAYPDPRQLQLREAIAKRDGVDAEQVICGNGAAELIFAVCDAVQPKKALLLAPGFAEYEQALAKCGSEICYYACKEENGFRMQEDYLDVLTDDVQIAFLCNPNNPTGALLNEELLNNVIKKCRERQILLVLDECFIGLTKQGDVISKKHLIACDPYLFILRAFTKLYAMAGLRLGYGLSSNEELLERMHACLQPWNVSSPAQMAGIAALGETDYEEKSRLFLNQERVWLAGRLRELGLTVFEPSANFVFFRGPEDLGDRCKVKGLLIRDCSNYRGLTRGYWRVAVRRHEENMQLVSELEEILSQHLETDRDLNSYEERFK